MSTVADRKFDICKGCGKDNSRYILMKSGYHFDCELCKYCDKLMKGRSLSFEHYGYHKEWKRFWK
jgi:hypothetical protein